MLASAACRRTRSTQASRPRCTSATATPSASSARINIGTVQDSRRDASSATTTGSWPTCTSRTTAASATTPSSPATPGWPGTSSSATGRSSAARAACTSSSSSARTRCPASASHVSQDVPPYMMVDGNPLAVRGFNAEGLRRRGFSAERIAVVKQMHRLLYREGLSLDEARARISALAASEPQAAGDIALMIDFLAAADPGHRALTCSLADHEFRISALRDGRGRGFGRRARRPAARRHARALAGSSWPRASAARRWRSRASRPGGRTTSWRCAATSRCSAISARSSASAISSPSG